tara:strand:+ start:40 stop:540 length:501 start_codon:yes stop_codon:yes gene_type:complete
MSKKSRKRNKRLLALAGLAGAVAMSNRKPKQSDVSQDSGRGSGLRDTVDTKKTDYITKKDTSKSDVAPVAKKESVPVGKMRGAGNTDAEAIAAQKKRAGNAQNIREAQADETSVGNYPTDTFIKPVNPKGRFNRKDGGRAEYKSGGKVKGCGKALRGFGKAMKGNR